VISDTGELMFRLPVQEARLAVFALGDPSFEWVAQAGLA